MNRIAGRLRRTLKHALDISVLAGTFFLDASGAPGVLQVGNFHGVAGQYNSIQAAVDAAKPGDWILIAPGDYREGNGESLHGGAAEQLVPLGYLRD